MTATSETIAAKAAIADLIHQYARLVRRDQPEGLGALFAPGGTFEVREGHPSLPEFRLRSRFESPEDLVAYLEQGKGKPHPVPLIHNLMIAIEGDTATADCVMEAQIHGTVHKVFGEYHDSFVKVDGAWRFSARIYTMFTS
ncbi:nuclear transport factor 2 family protein [Novosphingobium album (ex Liu et al. 2023)]|uniref:Nuclear transport factor 2 family protein n=1 Tax=Novosphingobium album (ex Liu et al. 2023) TaxID=3031130 RepID=A0ABT5WM41_9SPHN|nr:nuclear transport factor 2 family protein [Novosphingobium album (ex Liu et al. 2023)]MDE8651111.1 nuclear transport factor 2 family protein [Novosphingobium album (ex Liu et al. 2023)]